MSLSPHSQPAEGAAAVAPVPVTITPAPPLDIGGDAPESSAKQPPPTKGEGEPWPVLHEDALHGVAGDIVRAVDPYTEADPVAVLVNLLVIFGNAIGASAHFRVEHTKHFLRLFVTLVGKTSKGRKGQSLSTPRHLFR